MKRAFIPAVLIFSAYSAELSEMDSLKQEIAALKRKIENIQLEHNADNEYYTAVLISLREQIENIQKIQPNHAEIQSKKRTQAVNSWVPGGWNHSEYRVTPGEWYISADGEWFSNPSHQMHSPAGSPIEPIAHEPYLLPPAPEGALIGKVGKSGRPFLIGSSAKLELFPCGELELNGKTIDQNVTDNLLYFSINDDPSWTYDNRGSVYVTFERQEPVKKIRKEKTVSQDAEYIDNPAPIIMEKPIIYLYPADTIDVSVKLSFADSGKFTYTYPTYEKKGWNVTACPDGKLIDKQGKSYYSLFWEGEQPILPDDSTGFVVHRDSLNSFFERSLDSLGLNYREKQEFIVYWSPKLMDNEYSFIHFSRKNYAQSAKLEITPTPTTVNRFLMLYRKSSATKKVVPQRLENPGRDGFTVVEWGGAEMAGDMCEIK